MEPIKKSIKEALIENALYQFSSSIYFVTETIGTRTIAPFAHPVIISHRLNTTIVVDVRQHGRLNNKGELQGGSHLLFAKVRSILMDAAWVDGEQRSLMNTGDFHMQMFGKVMGENIKRRMNLEPTVGLTIEILASYFYGCQFYSEKEFKDDIYHRLVKRISRTAKVPVQGIYTIVDGLGHVSNIHQFTDALKERTGSIRLDKMNPGLLFSMLGGMWFGPNHSEVIGTAIEHPPTFCAIIYVSLVDRSFRNTSISQLILNHMRGNDLPTLFKKNIEKIILSSEYRSK